MSVNLFIYLGAVFASAFIAKVATSRLGIPEVTGYVIVGVLAGTSVTSLLGPSLLDTLAPVSDIALALIAFIIGVELRWKSLRKLGGSIVWIVLLEALGAFFVVYTAISFLFPGPLERALLLGAVAAATAPAATVAVIRQYRAKGPLTSTIMAVVGIDDAMALIIYVLVSSYAKMSLLGNQVQVWNALGSAAASLGVSLLLGAVFGLAYLLILRKTRDTAWIELLLAAVLLFLLGLSEQFHVSELLSVMVFGAVITNGSEVLSRRSSQIVDHLSPIFLAAFFVLGGAHLDITLIGAVGLIGLVYFAARTLGKVGGATIGAFLGRAPKTVRGRIGFALLPQVGVALALALSINKEFTSQAYGVVGTDIARYVINILLLTTILTEVVGPLATRRVLRRAGEIKTGDA